MAPNENTPIPNHIDPEITEVLKKSASTAAAWRTVSFVLGLILAGGTVLGVAGRAFYVTRTEYTEKSQNDSVQQATLSQALSSIKETLRDQSAAFRELQAVVNELKVDVVMKRRPHTSETPNEK